MKVMEETWTGCYDAGWKGLIADEAFAHPAKFSRNLIGRIYRHMLDRGWLAPGMSVVDPFGGVALGALDAMVNGLHWTGCELEPRFHSLGNQNIAEWVRRYGHVAGWGSARLLNGDSRRLVEVVGGADCVVSSPPYAEAIETRAGPSGMKVKTRADGSPMGYGRSEVNMNAAGYGQSPGQLGGMKAGSVDAVLSSPPFGESQQVDNRKNPASAMSSTWRKRQGEITDGLTDGQLANLKTGNVDSVISSPPYSAGTVHEGNGIDQSKLTGNKPGKNTQAKAEGYGTAPGSLGNLRPGSVEAVVSSPPWENSEPQQDKNFHAPHDSSGNLNASTYGRSEGQIGNETGETFWYAAREIVQQCHAILRPGGVAAWVTKDFVRNKARVPFSADWLKLCEACGFELVEWVKASLVKDLGKHADLYGETHHRTVERKSFFRRLAEKKGSPRIDWEDVIFVRKVG